MGHEIDLFELNENVRNDCSKILILFLQQIVKSLVNKQGNLRHHPGKNIRQQHLRYFRATLKFMLNNDLKKIYLRNIT